MTSRPRAAAAIDRAGGASAAQRWSERAEQYLELTSERLNPILVKEARQALKSRQFSVTFSMLLTFGWAWSMLGVALLSPSVYYAPGGRFMLCGYFLVLAAPVLVIVPFSAFRSLAAEREDGTFELLSITSLSSRQIVTGKLGSAVLQMLVYYSALAPCIAFTYLLRGVDIVTILLVLSYTLLASLLLSAVGLVVSTASNARHWQVVLSVLLLIGLLIALILISTLLINMIGAFETSIYRRGEFWVAHLAVLSFYVSFLVLLIQAAASQLSFASDNRSTRLRVVMLCQQMLWIGWMTYIWLLAQEDEFLFVIAAVGAAYWAVMGSLLSGEMAQLSPRVKRSLPQSFLGRMAFTWFNPGSGTGYTFAVSNLLTIVIGTLVLGVLGQLAGFSGAPNNSAWAIFSLLLLAYVAAYLGIGRLLFLLIKKLIPAGLLLSMLINSLVIVVAVAAPVMLQAWLVGYGRLSYSSMQLTNWAWTLVEAADGNIWAYPVVVATVLLGSSAIFLLNLAFTVAEVEQVRTAIPQRVLADEVETGLEGQPKSPDGNADCRRPEEGSDAANEDTPR